MNEQQRRNMTQRTCRKERRLPLSVVYVVVASLLLSTLGSSPNAFGTSSGEITVYPSSKVDEIRNVTIAGVALEKYGYVEVYQYVLVNADMLFVLGATKSEKLVLSAISLKDQKANIVVEYPEDLAWSLPQAAIRVFFLPNVQPPTIHFIMIEYTAGNLARQLDETETYLDILRPDTEDTYILLRREKIAKTNVVFYKYSELEFKYRYLEVDHSRTGPGAREPAKKETAKVFLCDANDDGYADILVWKQRYVSRLIEDPGEEDFVLEKEAAAVMYFEENGLTFSALTPLSLGEAKNISDLPFLNQ